MKDLTTVVDVRDTVLSEIVEKKVTCPFVGPAVATRTLAIRNDADNPLASIEDVRRLGNTGGGDLGDFLALFAKGNHAFMRGSTNQLDQRVPNDLFSLEFPGSQGSHPGHSGILQGNPAELSSGRFSEQEFARLSSRVRDGFLKRSDVGHFIAENLRRDPQAKVLEAAVATLLLGDLAEVLLSAGGILPSLFGSDEDRDLAYREFEQKLTKLMGENNLVGAAGEFGLLFAFLANSPRTKEVDDEPALSFDDVRVMFVEHRLPEGWERWKKTRRDVLRHTTGLLKSAFAEYRRLK